MSNPIEEYIKQETRRQFFSKMSMGLGGAALASLLGSETVQAEGVPMGGHGALGAPNFAPKAKRVIYLFMSGAPSQHDMYDYKPYMKIWHNKDLPDEIREGQRLTTMTSKQDRFPIAHSIYDFKQHGQSGAWISELLPYTARVADDLTFIKSMHTEAINHDPAITFIQTGRQTPGLPSLGSWVSYGLGTEK